jgi:hypothetical protein
MSNDLVIRRSAAKQNQERRWMLNAIASAAKATIASTVRME